MALMRKVARARREMQTCTPDEIRLVLRAADKDRNGHLWYLALSGLRRAEIAGLRSPGVAAYELTTDDANEAVRTRLSRPATTHGNYCSEGGILRNSPKYVGGFRLSKRSRSAARSA